MTSEEFTRLASTWGGDIERWPPLLQDEAKKFAGAHPDAASILERAAEFDRLLAGSAPVVSGHRADAVTHAVVTRLAAAPIPVRQSLSRRWLAPALSFACAASLGIYLGFAYPVVLSGPGSSIAGKALVMILEEDTMLPWIR